MGASEKAVAAVMERLGCERDECSNPNCECRTTSRKDCLEHDVAWTDRGCPVAVAAADAAVDTDRPSIQAQIEALAAEYDERSSDTEDGNRADAARLQEFADRHQGYYQGVVGTRRNCRDQVRAVLADAPAASVTTR